MSKHTKQRNRFAVAGIAILSGITLFLSGCSSDGNDTNVNNDTSVADTATQQGETKVSDNLPDTGSCPANLGELSLSYGLQAVDDPRTITEEDIDQIYVDYADGSKCDLLGAPEPKAVAEAAKSAICEASPAVQSAAVAQLEAMSKFLYGHGFGAVNCTRTGTNVIVDTDMLAGTGPYAPY